MFMLMAGGGVRGGQVIGESDETASAPKHEAISPDDVAASFYHNLGIDPTTEFQHRDRTSHHTRAKWNDYSSAFLIKAPLLVFFELGFQSVGT